MFLKFFSSVTLSNFINTKFLHMTNTGVCPFCEIIVKVHNKAIYCGLCSKWIHVNCNNFD